jgi:hypothetical protein
MPIQISIDFPMGQQNDSIRLKSRILWLIAVLSREVGIQRPEHAHALTDHAPVPLHHTRQLFNR